MKKLILAFSLLAITATTAFAGTDKKITTLTAEQQVDNSIQNQLNMPAFLTESPGEYIAELHFRVAPDGSILIKDIVSDNEDLKHDLMYQSKSISVNTNGLDPDASYKMAVHFKVTEQN